MAFFGNYRIYYLTEFDLYINIVLIEDMLFVKVLFIEIFKGRCEKVVKREDTQRGKTNKQTKQNRIYNYNYNRFDHTKKKVYAQPRICLGEWYAQIALGFWGINGSPNLGQITRCRDSKKKLKKERKKNRTCRIVDFAVPAVHWVKSKERERKISNWTLPGNWEKNRIFWWQIGTLGKVTKGLMQGLEYLKIKGRVVTTQTTAFRSARIQRRIRETWRNYCHSNADVKKLSKEKKNNNKINK